MSELIAMLLGYVTTPLVSLGIRRHWPTPAKLAVAAALAALAAAAEVVAMGSSWYTFATHFAAAFATQQAAWRLDPIGLGSARVNEPLLDVGENAGEYVAGAQDDEPGV